MSSLDDASCSSSASGASSKNYKNFTTLKFHNTKGTPRLCQAWFSFNTDFPVTVRKNILFTHSTKLRFHFPNTTCHIFDDHHLHVTCQTWQAADLVGRTWCSRFQFVCAIFVHIPML